jgi:F-type H+-transporting ATPase subunit a
MAAGGGHSPMEQFAIKRIAEIKIGGLDVSLTNSALWMIAVGIISTAFLVYAMRERAMVPGRLQSAAEMLYEFVASVLKETVGTAGRPYFPLVFTLFVFILFSNLFGMLPYSFTVTSHIAITFALALLVFIIVTVLGFVKHGLHFLHFFVPAGVPGPMLLLVVPLEVLSYFIRPISLSVRLFANMTAGHTMLKVFGGFVVAMGVFGIAPLIVIVALTGLEVLIACLQAYVFTVLTCLYLNDAIHMEH